jgi:short-subunit dehydrogenase
MEGKHNNMKTVLITGAARGFGKALTSHFLDKGFQVIACDIDLEELEKQFPEKSLPCFKYFLDVSQFDQWMELASILKEKECEPDILINNAGIIRPGFSYQLEQKTVDDLIDINTKGVIFGTSIFGKVMAERKSGHIINIASLAGIAPVYGLSLYCASKFAVRGFSLAAAQELIDLGVYVSCICPDGAKTPMLQTMAADSRFAMAFSGKKLLLPEDLVNAVNRVLKTKEMEVLIPKSRGWVSKLASLNIEWGVLLKNSLLQKGAKRQLKYQEEIKAS